MTGKIKYIIILIISVLLLSSCFDVETEITVKKDGSGIIMQKVLFSQMLVAQMSGLAASFGAEEEENSSLSMYDEEKLKSEASSYGEGVEFLSGREITEGEKAGYEVKYSFDDIRTLRINSNPSAVLDMPQQEEGEPDLFSFEFSDKGKSSILTVIMAEPESEENVSEELAADYPSEQETDIENSEVDDQTMSIMKQMFSGMKFSYRIKIDGKITDTDADNVDGQVITLIEMDFDKLLENPDSFNELENLQGDNSDEAVKAMKDMEGVKVELKDRIKITYR